MKAPTGMSAMSIALKSGSPPNLPMIGIRMLSTNDVTTVAKARPMTNATANSMRFPLTRKSLNPLSTSACQWFVRVWTGDHPTGRSGLLLAEQHGELLPDGSLGQGECGGVVDRDLDGCAVAERARVVGGRRNHHGDVVGDDLGGQSAARIAADHVDPVSGLEKGRRRRVEDADGREYGAGIEAGEQLRLHEPDIGQRLTGANRRGQAASVRRVGRIERPLGYERRLDLDDGDVRRLQHVAGPQVDGSRDDGLGLRWGGPSGLDGGDDCEGSENRRQRTPARSESASQLATEGLDSGTAHAGDRRRPATPRSVVHSPGYGQPRICAVVVGPRRPSPMTSAQIASGRP